VQTFRVCVTDDSVDEAEVLCEGLKLHGYESVAVHSGKAVLDLCAEGGIDLILLDVGLPDMDGFAVCEQLKANKATSEIPIIFVTGRGDSEAVNRAYALGAFDYITKPYNLPIIMIRVDSAMRTRQNIDFSQPFAESLLDTAYTDQLTGLRNRRFLMERLQEEVEKAHRYDYPVSCLMVDVDEVRAMNADLGTASLDDVLIEIAMAMRNASRTYDILCRFDGAVLAAVLPHARLRDAITYAEKIKEEVSSTTLSDPSFPTQATLSFGIVSCRNGSSRGADHLVGEAMRRLLRAKSNGGHSPIEGRDLADG